MEYRPGVGTGASCQIAGPGLIIQPPHTALYVGETDNSVAGFARPFVDSLEKRVANLWNNILLTK